MTEKYKSVETKKTTEWRRTDPDVETSALIRCEYGMRWSKWWDVRPQFSINYVYQNGDFGRDTETIRRHFPELLE